MQRNVSLRVGRPFRPESVKGDQVVLTCCGSRPRSADLFADPSVLRRRGQIRVNRFMQVLSRPSGLTSLGSLASPSGELGSAADPLGEGQGRSGEYVALGGGRIFAVGDAAAVDGVPTAQMIFHGEELGVGGAAGGRLREVSPLGGRLPTWGSALQTLGRHQEVDGSPGSGPKAGEGPLLRCALK